MSFCQKGDYKEMAPSPRFDIPYYRKVGLPLLLSRRLLPSS